MEEKSAPEEAQAEPDKPVEELPASDSVEAAKEEKPADNDTATEVEAKEPVVEEAATGDGKPSEEPPVAESEAKEDPLAEPEAAEGNKADDQAPAEGSDAAKDEPVSDDKAPSPEATAETKGEPADEKAAEEPPPPPGDEPPPPPADEATPPPPPADEAPPPPPPADDPPAPPADQPEDEKKADEAPVSGGEDDKKDELAELAGEDKSEDKAASVAEDAKREEEEEGKDVVPPIPVTEKTAAKTGENLNPTPDTPDFAQDLGESISRADDGVMVGGGNRREESTGLTGHEPDSGATVISGDGDRAAQALAEENSQAGQAACEVEQTAAAAERESDQQDELSATAVTKEGMDAAGKQRYHTSPVGII